MVNTFGSHRNGYSSTIGRDDRRQRAFYYRKPAGPRDPPGADPRSWARGAVRIAARSSPLNQESTNVTHERLMTTPYDEQNGASAATIKRKAPPNTANPSTNNRDLDLANEMPFPTQPPNRAVAGPLVL